ncbi:MAG: hypothetical protein IIV57_04170 [Bacteroidaceae bacterium]|nr:hypothetical protein [Bacteroidaceae bacterium]
MKKNYIAPEMEELNLVAEQLLAVSITVDGDKTVDTSTSGSQLGNDRRGEWGDLWK